MQLKRTFLLSVIGSLSFSALLGIWAFAFGDFGDTEWKIIFTTLTAALFSLTSLGAAIVYERGRWRPIMVVTYLLSGLGLVVYLLMIWVEPGWNWEWYEFVTKSMVIIAVWSIAMPHAGLIHLAPLRGGYIWARRTTIIVIAMLAVLITLGIITEPDGELFARAFGVLGILVALGTIAVPILIKVVGIEKEAGVESTPLDIKITCPRCLLEQTVSSGFSRCAGCKLRFEIKIEEPRCPQCDYLLHKLIAPVCPECGYALGDEEVVGEPEPTIESEPTQAGGN